MLSYRHAFHAGNFADVLKHTVLVQILRYLGQKDKAFCYVDTHAGPGDYVLTSEYALKNREFDNGIGRLWQRDDTPACVADYVQLAKQANAGGQLGHYPGSPRFAKILLRPQDRLFLYELHPTEQKILQKSLGGDKRATIIADDGLKHASGLLPPHERRGLVLIDPSYELKNDYESVVETLIKMHKRFATGTYALWYPVVSRRRTQALEHALHRSGIANMHLFELGVQEDSQAPGMTACGMLVINPPWTLPAEMQTTLPWLADTLGIDGAGFYRIQTLAE
ncbi:MAG: 23S rRNA (adenine(2030)-N(6))-methyltransferase RlmJ [Methylovulum sp.]|uniref:23S rRNA (adenine(2030)-N(6))-methyltransferase RlmJ n=1 Tax=Methylovulum sp. TaxID=1916980 RepID=UPI00262DD650|nr:23S rRNA (adenine(2030)-N(6))-methyltransferase RlmJ [Methylovulum sp.]MDD2725132.1 23S rRNA (adenine(2030)-N(6))-methyltransferase RlmJ [Methylovulum sp.]MDD5126412.1 23S rRNA (adenine(2030)-N(6))-methyltransferase RlmJ [Methylovulum sp.]